LEKLDFLIDYLLKEDCNCLMGNDIGTYNTCGHLCKYCYANFDEEKIELKCVKMTRKIAVRISWITSLYSDFFKCYLKCNW